MSAQTADLTDPVVLSAVAAFQDMSQEQRRAVFREQYEIIASSPGAARYSAVPRAAVAHLRDLVNLAVSRPAMDKMRPAITGMDAKYILAEILPMLLPLYNGTLVDATLETQRQVRDVMERAITPRPDIKTPEDRLEYQHSWILSALALLGSADAS